jgi:hypothetical protein
LDYYIQQKEQTGDEAKNISYLKVEYSEHYYQQNIKELIRLLVESSKFYEIFPTTHEECLTRISFLKHEIEHNDGYRLFYKDDKPIGNENDLKIMFRLTWMSSPSDTNSEVNNGRGPVDFKASRGSLDKSLVEFKLASNSHLRKNLMNQLEIYKKADRTDSGIKVVLYFTENEYINLTKIIKDLEMENDKNIVIIDARNDNKPSASVATTH